jgi:prephenate dehydrogenase
LPIIKKDCIITDVGSTKNNIFNDMLRFGTDINYIGGHPMAGSEQTSYKAAKPFLLENAYYVLTPSPTVSSDKINTFKKLIQLTGAIPIVIKPDEHDYTVAAISHVPHIIAASLVNMVKSLDSENQLMHALAAGGFKDTTRIASSSPEVWSSICADNKECILKVIDSFKAELDNFANAISNDSNDLSNLFAQAREYRNSFNEKKAVSYMANYELWVDVAEKNGIIAHVAAALSLNDINIKSIGVINNREYADGILQIVLESKEARDKCHKLLTQMNYTVYDK